MRGKDFLRIKYPQKFSLNLWGYFKITYLFTIL